MNQENDTVNLKPLLGIPLPRESRKEILEKIDKALFIPGAMVHVVSLNPENLVISTTNDEFKEVLTTAQIKLIDGVGVRLGALIKGIPTGERWTGVDFMNSCIKHLSDRSLRIVFLGGKPGLAEKVAGCYSHLYPRLSFYSLMGIEDVNTYKKAQEGAYILNQIHTIKPHIIFSSFGSPFQELWFWHNRDELRGIICAGVGGAFDFVGGNVSRAPKVIQVIGFEWLYRLIKQPWRWRRQLRLLSFVRLLFTYRNG